MSYFFTLNDEKSTFKAPLSISIIIIKKATAKAKAKEKEKEKERKTIKKKRMAF